MSDEQESVSDPRDVTIRQQAETIREQTEQLKPLEDEVKRLLALLEGKADAKAAKKPVFKENDSLDRNRLDRKSLIDWGESNPTIDKLALSVFATNTRAIALYRNFGFVEEGRRIKEVKLGQGKCVDDILMYRLVDKSDA